MSRTSMLAQLNRKIIDIDIFLAVLNTRFGPRIQSAAPFEELTREELLYGHTLLHLYFSKLKSQETYRGWTRENVVFTHRKIVNEMERRDIQHQYNDELDE